MKIKVWHCDVLSVNFNRLSIKKGSGNIVDDVFMDVGVDGQV